MDVTFLRRSARKTPSRYRRATPAPVAQEVEDEANDVAIKEVNEEAALVPIQDQPSPLMVVPPEDSQMYVPAPPSSDIAPVSFLSIDNIQAIATGFVQLQPGVVSAEALNADDSEDV